MPRATLSPHSTGDHSGLEQGPPSVQSRKWKWPLQVQATGPHGPEQVQRVGQAHGRGEGRSSCFPSRSTHILKF